MDAPSSQTEVFGTSITIPYTIPTKENYSFLGWSLYSTATSPSYYPGGTFDIYVTTTLYAIWAEQTFQDIYIYSDMTMYAKEFIEDNSMYIDKYGRLYAGEFIEGSAYIDSGGAIAMNEFIEGSLNTLVDENNNILTDEDGNQLVGLN